MQNFRSIIGKLGDFAVADLWQTLGVRRNARICGHDTIYICPDPDVVGREKRADNSSCVIASATAQSGDYTFGSCSNKTCCDWDNSGVQKWI